MIIFFFAKNIKTVSEQMLICICIPKKEILWTLWLKFLLSVDHDSVAPDPYVGPDPADQSCDGLHPHVGAGRDWASVL